MPSLSPKDRVSLCLFSFTDGRRCRTPRADNHPHFCFYHAQKEARAQAADSLGKDLACFFSGDYLPACDLSTAMARLIPAVVRGDIKPRLARTVAYMLQTQLQAIHISQHEYINAYGTDGWRKAHPLLRKRQLRPPLSPHPRTRTATTRRRSAATTHTAAYPPHSQRSRVSAQFSPAPISSSTRAPNARRGRACPDRAHQSPQCVRPNPALLALTRNPSKINTYSDSRNRKFPQHLRRA
jgi:hypothetical protein